MASTILSILPETAAGIPTGKMLGYCVGAVIVGVLVNMLLVKVFEGTKWAEVYLDSPYWAYYVCMLYQAVIFPLLLFLSLQEYDFDLEAHNLSSWETCNTKDVCWMRVSHIALLSYLIKDIFYCTPLQVIHHVAGSLFLGAFMFIDIGTHGFIAACLTLEVGNFFFNLSHLTAKRGDRLTFYAIALAAFTFVHIPGCAFIYQVVFHRPNADQNMAFFYFLLVSAAGVIFLREREAISNFSACRDAQLKDKGKKGK